jgi:hypothetical protein
MVDSPMRQGKHFDVDELRQRVDDTSGESAALPKSQALG